MSAMLSIGLMGYIKRDDFNLFSHDQFGVEDSALRTMAEQLHAPYRLLHDLALSYDHRRFDCIFDVENPTLANSLAAIVPYECLDGSDFTSFIENQQGNWHDPSVRLNSLDRFDAWSRFILERELLSTDDAG